MALPRHRVEVFLGQKKDPKKTTLGEFASTTEKAIRKLNDIAEYLGEHYRVDTKSMGITLDFTEEGLRARASAVINVPEKEFTGTGRVEFRPGANAVVFLGKERRAIVSAMSSIEEQVSDAGYEVLPGTTSVNTAFDGKEIHATATAKARPAQEKPEDPETDISARKFSAERSRTLSNPSAGPDEWNFHQNYALEDARKALGEIVKGERLVPIPGTLRIETRVEGATIYAKATTMAEKA